MAEGHPLVANVAFQFSVYRIYIKDMAASLHFLPFLTGDYIDKDHCDIGISNM